MHIYLLTHCNANLFNLSQEIPLPWDRLLHASRLLFWKHLPITRLLGSPRFFSWQHWMMSTSWDRCLEWDQFGPLVLLFWILLSWKFLRCGPRLAWETWHRMSSGLASLLSIQCLAYELWLQYQDWKVAVGEGSGTIMFTASEPFPHFRTPIRLKFRPLRLGHGSEQCLEHLGIPK